MSEYPSISSSIGASGLSGFALNQQILKYNTAQLIQLLGHYEAELQARDVALAVLKAERARSFIERNNNFVKDGCEDDAELALLRDAATLGNLALSDELSLGFFRQHKSQFQQLTNVVGVQSVNNKKTKQALNALEKRHSKILYEINLEKERAQNNTLKSDEFFLLIENERSKMQTQLDQKDDEIKALEKQLKSCNKSLSKEKDRGKVIILFLITERKQLLLKLNDMRMRLNSKNDVQDSPLVLELKRQVIALNEERENLSNLVNNLKSEKDGLQRKVSHLEEDLLLIQQNILYKTREKSETLNRPTRIDSGSGFIMANKGAFVSEQRHQQHHTLSQHPASNQPQHFIQTSASFPSAHYAPSSGISNSTSSGSMASKHSSLQRPVSRPPQILKATAPKSTLTASTTISAASNHINNNNPSAPINHSTILLHRPSTRPPLGIKASNLPLSRNLSVQSTSNQPLSNATSGTTSYRTTTLANNNRRLPSTSTSTSILSSSSSTMIPAHGDYKQQMEYVVLDTQTPKALTKRSSSLPRNIVQNAQLNYIHSVRNNNLFNS